MLTLLTVTLVILAPFAVVAGLLALAAYRDRVREERRVRQIAVTEAIHREVGPVVAPVVRRRIWGRWQLLIELPPERAALGGAVLGAAQRALDAPVAPSLEIVLVPRRRLPGAPVSGGVRRWT